MGKAVRLLGLRERPQDLLHGTVVVLIVFQDPFEKHYQHVFLIRFHF